MRFTLWTTFLCLALTLGAGPLHAQQIDVRGTWSGEGEMMLESEGKVVEVPRRWSVVIQIVDGAFVRGYHKWEALTDNPGYVGSVPTLSASEPFIDTIDSDGVTLRLVETDDPGMMICELLDRDRLEVTYMETAPHPVAVTLILKRKPD